MTSTKKPSLAETHPDVAALAFGWNPRTLKANSSRKMRWECSRNHVWDATVINRVKGSGCPFCSGHKAIVGETDLATTNPELAAQADGWDPATVKAGSKKKMQWQCQRGHIWQATVSNRSLGNGCPFCSGHKAIVGETDLATTNPELAAQADGWDPATVKAGSSKNLSWRCAIGHVWKTSVVDRAGGAGCPVCAGQKVLSGFNDLATTNPELAAQADGWDPTTVTEKSGKRKNWKCDLGHAWEAVIGSRASGHGCPMCSGHTVIPGQTDLATINPELAAQADGWDPTAVTSKSGQKVRWKCKFGHSWAAAVSTRAKGHGCPMCSGHTVIPGQTDLATINPELAAQADGWDPTAVTSKSGQKVRWKCDLGHSWEASVSSRANGNGCPYCASQKVLIGFNDLASFAPKISSEADGWDPTTVTSKSGRKLKWKCDLGHSWEASVSSRANGNGCPTCSNRKVLIGFNDLATTNPELASQADGWKPTTTTTGSEEKKNWRCSMGHVWKATPANRHKGAGCLVCCNQQVLVGFNDLSTLFPNIAKSAYNWDPRTATPKSGKKAQWKCELGHIWTAVIASRTNGHGCPLCSGHSVITGQNDLATIDPELAYQADGWDPSQVMPGTPKKMAWICSEGHKWSAAVSSRSRGNGCPLCATHGFKPAEPGWLYLVFSDSLEMFQIGISNVPERRLAEHHKNGFDRVLDLRGPMDGIITQHLERQFLMALSKRKAIFANKAGLDKFDGYTEAWTEASLQVTSIKQMLDWVYEDEEIK